jgi:hypothetical protein
MVMTDEWKMPVRRRVTQDEVDQAIAADAEVARSELRAAAVAYDPVRDLLLFTVRHGGDVIGVPRRTVEELSDLPSEDLQGLRLWPDGVLLEIPERDLHLQIPKILAQAIERLAPPALLRSLLARMGGSATSERKRRAAAENGRRGGRPRKQAAVA